MLLGVGTRRVDQPLEIDLLKFGPGLFRLFDDVLDHKNGELLCDAAPLLLKYAGPPFS